MQTEVLKTLIEFVAGNLAVYPVHFAGLNQKIAQQQSFFIGIGLQISGIGTDLNTGWLISFPADKDNIPAGGV